MDIEEFRGKFPYEIERERMFTINKLTTEVENLLTTIDESIEHLQIRANQLGIPIYEVKHMDGSSALTPILMAKAKALHTLVLLETRQD
jgi:hypothetical protein